MEYVERKNEVPSSILTSLEDLTTDILDLQELILALAASADNLPTRVRCDSPEFVN